MFVTQILSRASSPKRGKKPDYDEILPRITFSPGIPRRLFQVYLTGKHKRSLLPEIEANIKHLQEINPDWEYFRLGDVEAEEFLLHHYGAEILSYYRRIEVGYEAAKADFVRYLLIYRFGGVYLDIKSTSTQPLSNVFSKKDCMVLSYWNNEKGGGHEGFGHYSLLPEYMERGEVMQWCIAASPGHPLLREVIKTMLYKIDNYNPYLDGVGWTGTVATTGPAMYSKVVFDLISEHPDLYPVRWANLIDDEGVYYSIFDRPQGHSPRGNHIGTTVSDYRKNCHPLVRSRSKALQLLNTWYLKILSRTHK